MKSEDHTLLVFVHSGGCICQLYLFPNTKVRNRKRVTGYIYGWFEDNSISQQHSPSRLGLVSLGWVEDNVADPRSQPSDIGKSCDNDGNRINHHKLLCLQPCSIKIEK